MDVQRTDVNRRKWIRRLTVTGLLVTVIPGATYLLSRLKPAAPMVEGGSVWPDVVKRGEMIRKVPGLGTLVAEDPLYIAATTEGRVERIHLRPGDHVIPETVILTLVNDELRQVSLEAEYTVKMAEATVRDLRVQLEKQVLSTRADLSRLETECNQAKLRLARDEKLFEEGLIIALNYNIVKSNEEDLRKRLEIERERAKISVEANEAQLAVRFAEIEKYRAMAELRRSQVDKLNVRAGIAGVLQELPGPTPNSSLQVGQRVGAGAVLAKVAQPRRLKAELRVAETQVPDVRIGQYVDVDTRNGVIPGRVSRIDPAAREGTVVVDVRLEGALPEAARPDLSVDGVIEIEKLTDVLYTGRPAFGQPNSTVSMFRLDEDGNGATRVRVRFGRSSVNAIEVVEGLREGEKVILSDMSAWDAFDRIRLGR